MEKYIRLITDNDLSTSTIDDGYRALGAAIVGRAVEDYQTEKIKLRRTRDPEKKKEHSENIKEINDFFESRWFTIITEDADYSCIFKFLDDYKRYKKKQFMSFESL